MTMNNSQRRAMFAKRGWKGQVYTSGGVGKTRHGGRAKLGIKLATDYHHQKVYDPKTGRFLGYRRVSIVKKK